jgi:hypothetical protein
LKGTCSRLKKQIVWSMLTRIKFKATVAQLYVLDIIYSIYHVFYGVWRCVEVEMVLVLVFLPLLLPEAPFVLQGTCSRGRKRQIWKPSVIETMEHFIDVQEVCSSVLVYYISCSMCRTCQSRCFINSSPRFFENAMNGMNLLASVITFTLIDAECVVVRHG